MTDLPCPCCGFFTLEGEYGSHAICDLCGWEDDGVQLASPTSEGGANSRSLAQAQEVALRKYPVHVQLAMGERRSTKWRPLRVEELSAANKRRTEKYWFAQAVSSEHEAYWYSA